MAAEKKVPRKKISSDKPKAVKSRKVLVKEIESITENDSDKSPTEKKDISEINKSIINESEKIGSEVSDNEEVKKNRLELLLLMCKTFDNFTDFSKFEGI